MYIVEFIAALLELIQKESQTLKDVNEIFNIHMGQAGVPAAKSYVTI